MDKSLENKLIEASDMIKNNWRYGGIHNLNNKNILLTDGDIYEFGVFAGLSLYIFVYFFSSINKIKKFHGFDSFKGLPLEKNDKLNMPEWSEGFLSVIDGPNRLSCDVNTVEDAKNFISKKWNFNTFEKNINLIDGFFCDSLNENTYKKYNMGKASIIDFDADQYTSTTECWDFIIKNNILQIGTLLFYDDWGLENEYLYGESKAHLEFTKKYNIECIELYDSEAGQKIFKVVNL